MHQDGITRRIFSKLIWCGAFGLIGHLGISHALAAENDKPAVASSDKTFITPDQALALLKEGNQKFTTDRMEEVAQGRTRRLEIASKQKPFAALVACSDSRVPPELLFSRGLGELFVVRNAGNTVDTVALGSLEFAVAALGVPLIVVLGHERCGAVDAAVQVVERNATYPGSLGRMIEPIVPAVLKARKTDYKDKEGLFNSAIAENVRRVVSGLRSSEPILLEPLRSGKLKIVGAVYDLDEGIVKFLSD